MSDAKQRRDEAAKRKQIRENQPPRREIELHHCGVDQLKEKIPAESLDVIVTDPPYPREFLHVWSQLSHFAGYALREGGLLVAMGAHHFTIEIVNGLNESEKMQLHWLASYSMPGGAVLHYQKRLFIRWKPLFLFSKGEHTMPDGMPPQAFNDEFRVPKLNKQDTRFHKWGQQEAGFKMLLEAFAFPGWTVCDPFLGGGTTAVVAHQRGCRFIGCDIDSESLEITRERIRTTSPMFDQRAEQQALFD